MPRLPRCPPEKPPSKPIYRIRNWKQYNDALVRRGSLTLWVDRATLQAWRYQGPPQRGAQFRYSDTAIQCVLTLRSVYHLPLRATEGFARSIFGLMGLDLAVPDYSTLCRRAKTLQITLPKKADGPLHLVIDSTGLKVYGEGEWKVRQHGYSKRRTWIKLHLAIDPEIARDPGGDGERAGGDRRRGGARPAGAGGGPGGGGRGGRGLRPA